MFIYLYCYLFNDITGKSSISLTQASDLGITCKIGFAAGAVCARIFRLRQQRGPNRYIAHGKKGVFADNLRSHTVSIFTYIIILLFIKIDKVIFLYIFVFAYVSLFIFALIYIYICLLIYVFVFMSICILEQIFNCLFVYI